MALHGCFNAQANLRRKGGTSVHNLAVRQLPQERIVQSPSQEHTGGGRQARRRVPPARRAQQALHLHTARVREAAQTRTKC